MSWGIDYLDANTCHHQKCMQHVKLLVYQIQKKVGSYQKSMHQLHIVSYLLSVFNSLRTTTFICSSTNLLWRASNTFWTSHSIYWTQCNAFCLAAQKKIPMWLFLTGLFLQLPNSLTILKTLWSVHSVSSAKKSYPNNVLPMDQMVAFFISVVMLTFTTSSFPFPMWSVIHWSTTA